MRAHSSGRVMSFVTERDTVRRRKILHLTGCKILHLTGCNILHLTGNDVSEAVRTTLALDISMSKRISIVYNIKAPLRAVGSVRAGPPCHPATETCRTLALPLPVTLCFCADRVTSLFYSVPFIFDWRWAMFSNWLCYCLNSAAAKNERFAPFFLSTSSRIYLLHLSDRLYKKEGKKEEG
jgi:thiosulfate reductase cytochrome b subunit